MQSKATSVEAYLAELPPDRRATISAVRDMVRANLDPVIQEGMPYGMIGWYIPHSVYPPGYHVNPAHPLWYAALASQKNYNSLYLMTGYSDGSPDERWFREAWGRTGKRLDMGKSCLRFRTIDDLALDVVAEAIRRVDAQGWIARYSALLDPATGKPRSTRDAKKPKKTAAKKAVKKPARKVARRAAARKTAPKKKAAKKSVARKAPRRAKRK